MSIELGIVCVQLFVYSWEREKCSLYEEVAAGCPLFRGF